MADTMTGLLNDVRQQREQLETVINSIDDGIVVLDADRRVVAANDALPPSPGEDARGGARRLLPRPGHGHVRHRRLPHPGVPPAGRAPGPHLRAPGRGRRDHLGRRFTPRPSGDPPGPLPRSSRSGATSRAPRGRGAFWPSPTGSPPWACWPRASRTSSTRRSPRCSLRGGDPAHRAGGERGEATEWRRVEESASVAASSSCGAAASRSTSCGCRGARARRETSWTSDRPSPRSPSSSSPRPARTRWRCRWSRSRGTSASG